MCQASISRKSSQTVIVRHTLSILAFTLGQIYMLLSFSVLVELDLSIPQPIFDAFCLLFTAQGIYMPLIRMSEKFFFKVVTKNIYDLTQLIFCCRRPNDFVKRSEVDYSSLLERDLFDDENELIKDASMY
jgi:hypothetical protein